TFGQGTKFDLAGPGRVAIPEIEFTLDAEHSLTGDLGADRRSGVLIADGAVRSTYHGDDLETENLRFALTVSEAGEQVIDVISEGATVLNRAASPAGDRGPVAFRAEGGLQLRSVGERLVVRSAHGVDVTATGPGAFHARAAHVSDFDWSTRAFEAEGDVAYESETGGGAAERAIARASDDIELIGTPERRASYATWVGTGPDRREESKVEARSIRARHNGFDAHGDVTAVLVSDRRHQLDGGNLHVDFEDAPPGDAHGPRRFHARVEEAVRARFESEKGVSTLACDRLFVDGVTKGTAPSLAAVPVEASTVRAEGSVEVDWGAEGGLAGRGDLFVLDPQGVGRLSAEAGKRVTANGRLAPESPPYAWTADW